MATIDCPCCDKAGDVDDYGVVLYCAVSTGEVYEAKFDCPRCGEQFAAPADFHKVGYRVKLIPNTAPVVPGAWAPFFNKS